MARGLIKSKRPKFSMKKRLLAVGCTALPLITLIWAENAGAQGQTSTPAATANASGPNAVTEKAFFNQYCVVCHNQKAKAANQPPALAITLDNLDVAHVEQSPESWERVVRKVRAGMMPPAGMPRPKPEVFEANIQWLENELDKHETNTLPPPGLHRLNRTEYKNAVRDVLALDIDPAKYLPSDDSTRGFDNIAGALSLSPALLEGYTSAAGKISRLAIGDITAPSQTPYRVPEDTSQDYHIDGMPFGTRGGLMVDHNFPADGEYSMKITPISKGNMGDTSPFGEITGEKMEFLLDGHRVKLFDWDKERAREDGTFNVKFNAKAGPHKVVVTFLATNYAPGNDLDQHFLRSTIETGGLPGYKFFPHVGKIRIDGPNNPQGASDTPSRKKIFVCTPANASDETACAKKIVSSLARHAFRRPVSDQDVEMLMGFYQQGRNNGKFDQGIEMAVRRVLVDPEFYFRKEGVPANVKAGQPYRISDLALASRLSFFLWSSVPDDELINVAAQNKLHEPATLDREVKRMLADQKAQALVENFAGQWFGLRALKTQSPVASEFPDFDDNLRDAMAKELELFVGSVIHEDRPITDLLDANYTFVNERLARHYGIPNVYGSAFRRVQLGPEFDMRRGLLGKGLIETVTAYPNRTAPTVRGKMVMQLFLGVEPPPPPPNVPALKESASDVHGAARPSMRQQMEMHRSVEPCASCHKIMDPIGFSLENFDAVGAWRTTDDGTPINPAGVLVDGSKLDGVQGLRAALVRYSPQFERVATEKLLIYALGRGTEYFDMPLVRSIIHNAAKNNFKFSSLVLGIVNSEPFQMNGMTQITEKAGDTKPVAANSGKSADKPKQRAAVVKTASKKKDL
jgi:mono/diheme cytochrome c family protein